MGGHHHDHGAHDDGHDHANDHSHSHNHNHSHDHSHSHCHENASRGRLAIAAVITGLFMIVEVIGGYISGSLALLADAGHMLTDFAALSMAWLAFVFAARPATPKLTFGYARLPVLAAFVNGLALFVIAALIIKEAVYRYGHIEDYEVLAGPMLWVALAGLAVNILVFRVLQGGDKDNLNVRGALLHVMGDMLGSAAAVMAAIIIMQTGYMAIDPILSVIVALLILRSAWYLVKASAHVLLEGAPEGLNKDNIQAGLMNAVKDIDSVESLHIWSISDEQPVMTLSVCAHKDIDRVQLTQKIRHYLTHDVGIKKMTIEVK